MPPVLNTDSVREAMRRAGLNASALAERLAVSRQAVTSWLKGDSQPRPDKVLRMSRLLNLSYGEIYTSDMAVEEPVVGYRKKGGAVTKPEHLERARRMGKVLETLVPALPFDEFDAPVRVKNPSLNYDYIQRLVAHFRQERKVGLTEKIPFKCLISDFQKRQAVLVPVLWGGSGQHGNGLHIHLPRSQVTWVYLNLESNLLDFKYWMAHELGHILLGEGASVDEEAFCESFAAALLFPRAAAERAFGDLPDQQGTSRDLEWVKRVALEYEVSPITVVREINRFAEVAGFPSLDFKEALYKATATLNKRIPRVSEQLFGRGEIEPGAFVKQSGEVFGTLFFDSLRARLKEVDDGAGLVQWVMDIPLGDAKGIVAQLK